MRMYGNGNGPGRAGLGRVGRVGGTDQVGETGGQAGETGLAGPGETVLSEPRQTLGRGEPGQARRRGQRSHAAVEEGVLKGA